MADLWLRETDRDEFIDAVVQAVIRELRQTSPQAVLPLLVDIDEMARLASVSRQTLERAVRDDRVPSVKFGRLRRFRPDAVIRALEAGDLWPPKA